jgi:hypothetical protein
MEKAYMCAARSTRKFGGQAAAHSRITVFAMKELLTFLLGLLATWVGLWMNEHRKKAERRKVTYARLYGALEAERRLMLESDQLQGLYGLFLRFQEKRKAALAKPNSFAEFVKVQNELHGLADEMLKAGFFKEQLAKLRKEPAGQRDSEKQWIKDRVAMIRDDLRRNLPSDEDIALLPYTLIPYFYEYRNRIERIASAIENLTLADLKKLEEAQLAKWTQQLIENILGIFLMAEILRKNAKRALKIRDKEALAPTPAAVTPTAGQSLA